jgi:hypothetical protein
MVKSFGYHFVAADTAGVNLFFVHESAAGSQPLKTLDDAKRLATNGGEYPMLHPMCSRHPWLLIRDDVDFSDSSIDLNDMPIVLLSTKPQGPENKQRGVFPTNVTASLRQKLASSPATPDSTPAAVQSTGVTIKVSALDQAFAYGATLEAWTVLAIALASFVAGVLLQRLKGSILAMILGRPSKV